MLTSDLHVRRILTSEIKKLRAELHGEYSEQSLRDFEINPLRLFFRYSPRNISQLITPARSRNSLRKEVITCGISIIPCGS